MNSSKSEENRTQGPKAVDNQVVAIIDTSVEREIQNILNTNEYDQNQPSCSWTINEQTGSKPPEVVLAKDVSTSSISISIDISCPPHIETAQECIVQSNEASSIGGNTQRDIGERSPPTNTGNEILQPTRISNRTSLQSPLVTHRTLPLPVVTEQPRAHCTRTNQCPAQTQRSKRTRLQSPFLSQTRTQPQPRPPDVPTTTRGVHVVNLPSDSINPLLQQGETLPSILPRADQVLGPPPSYSKSLLDRRINTCASIQFVAPIPPPSYDGMESELRYAHTLGHTGGFTLGLGNTWQGQPQPAYCPICETVIITQVDIRVSRIAHIAAMVMFLLLCWPFCLLPYFLNICNYTFHYCSICHSYLGARRPFQRG